MSEPWKTGLISSIAVLGRTGISRATLNNYIKMGMIPPPIVKKPDDPSIKAKQLGYFQDSVLGTIEKIKLYKKERRSMKEIGSLLSLKTNRLPGERFPEIPKSNTGTFSEKRYAVNGQNTNHEKTTFFVPFSVLVADLQDSVRICAELPPEEYFSLIHQIWKYVEGSSKKFYGAYGEYTGEGMVYYFLKSRDSNYLMNAILCALELKGSMKNLSNEWKSSKGWFNDLFMNIGISEGEDYFGAIPASTPIGLRAFGNSVNYAYRLSHIARYGSILTTKNLMNRLNEEERKKIRYGILRKQQGREVMIENVFSRVMDLVPLEYQSTSKFFDISTLPVTEVLNFC
ncbi:MAG: adenylate/guanylate cyclase domain-containing protein [Deltaproteobacteria bacterium]|nr:adenylate/guanylate cyclase domain-containing protein [Deltaproteobacteria bacterium]